MNIALLTTGFETKIKEATKITILSLAKELKRTGHRPIIISDKRENLAEEEIIDGVEVYRKYGKTRKEEPLKFFNYFIIHPLTINYLKKKGITFDIIHNFSSSPILTIRSILAKSVSKQSKLVHSIKSKSKYKNYFLTRILNFNDKITVQTNFQKSFFVERGIRKDKIEIIRSHIDTNWYKPLNKKLLRKKHKIKDKKVVLYYGPFAGRKGVEYLLNAIPDVTKKIKNILFIFVIKPTNKYYQFKKIFKKKHIAKHSKVITGFVNIPEYINLADVVALPYPNLIATESNPSSIIECMSCMTPVVTTNLPEIKEVFENSVLLSEPKNSKDIAEKIIQLISDKTLKKKLVKEAHKKSKNFSVKKITQEYLQLYNKLLIE